MQVMIILILVLGWAVVSAPLSFCVAYWRVVRRFKADAAPVITRHFRVQNIWTAITLICFVALLIVWELVSPVFHDRVVDSQYRIGDLFRTNPPGLNLPVSLTVWLPLTFGLLLGLVPGQWVACRAAGRYFMAAVSKIRLIHLISNPWV